MWEPRRLTALWTSTARYWDSFTFAFLPLMTWRGVSGTALALSTVSKMKPSLDKRRSEMLTNRAQPWGEWQEAMKTVLTTRPCSLQPCRPCGPQSSGHYQRLVCEPAPDKMQHWWVDGYTNNHSAAHHDGPSTAETEHNRLAIIMKAVCSHVMRTYSPALAVCAAHLARGYMSSRNKWEECTCLAGHHNLAHSGSRARHQDDTGWLRETAITQPSL
jgi:hypothetical protein